MLRYATICYRRHATILIQINAAYTLSHRAIPPCASYSKRTAGFKLEPIVCTTVLTTAGPAPRLYNKLQNANYTSRKYTPQTMPMHNYSAQLVS